MFDETLTVFKFSAIAKQVMHSRRLLKKLSATNAIISPTGCSLKVTVEQVFVPALIKRRHFGFALHTALIRKIFWGEFYNWIGYIFIAQSTML